MCKLCITYIHDYLNLKEYIHDPRLSIRQKPIARLSQGLAADIHKYFSRFYPFTQDHLRRICKDAARDGKRRWPDHETDLVHRLQVETLVVNAFLQECREIELGDDINYWCILLQEAGLSRSSEAVEHWLGTKLVNVFLVLEGAHKDHSCKRITEFQLPVGLRAHVESKDDDDLYT